VPPWPTLAGAFSRQIGPLGRQPFPSSYFDAFQVWHLDILQRYYPGISLTSPMFRADVPGFVHMTSPYATSYHLSCSFGAGADFWNPRTRSREHPLVVQALTNAQFPSLKALVILPEYFGRGVSAGFFAAGVDAAVAERAPTGEVTERGESFDLWNLGAVHFSSGCHGYHTLNGVQGRDFVSR
jgi:hypothetical protein